MNNLNIECYKALRGNIDDITRYINKEASEQNKKSINNFCKLNGNSLDKLIGGGYINEQLFNQLNLLFNVLTYNTNNRIEELQVRYSSKL
jgi:hypothetical protein